MPASRHTKRATTPKLRRQWEATELAYLAGFLDGEGSITVFNFVDKRYPRRQGSVLRLSAYNTNLAVLEWIAFRFGGRVGLVKRRRIDWKQSYIWERGGRNAAEIIEACLPFFKVKRQQAELFMEVAATIRNWGKNKIPNEVVDFRRAAALRMSVLNGGRNARSAAYEESEHSKKA